MEAHELLGAPALANDGRSSTAVARRVVDLGIALTALILLFPLLLVIAIAIRIDSRGPALFRQCRLGRGMAPFTVLKFRTMRETADSAPHREYVRKLINGDAGRNGRDNLYKLAVDARITRVGRFLRSWSLDELPQLWNIVRGDMSLIGPRPVIPYEVEHYRDWYLRRFAVKPGLTGLWQVSGRNERTYEEMVELDIEYVEGRSLLGDARIMLKTFDVVLRRQGAA